MKILEGFLEKNPKVLAAVDVWFAEMQAGGWLTVSGIYPQWQRYLALSDNGKIVSFMIFERAANKSMIRIKAAWTDPAYRRQGLYDTLWNELVSRYRGMYGTIRSGFHKSNKASEAMQIKQGRKIVEGISGNGTHMTSYYELNPKLNIAF
jgi:ribosomal protein S18 acetylase RimI-like enzyme